MINDTLLVLTDSTPYSGVLTVLTVYMKIGFKMRVPASFVNIFGKYEKLKKKLVKYLSIWSFSRSDSSSLRKWLVLHYFSGNTICIRKRPFQKWLLKSTNHSRLALSRQKALSNAILIKHVTVKEISTIIPIMLDASQPFSIRF